MIRNRATRLRVPIAMAFGGSALTVATLVGFGWERATGPAVVTVLASVGYYLLGGRDTDTGDLSGGRPDERQLGIVTQATALAGQAVSLVALGGWAVTTALGHPAWPFLVVTVVAAAAFVGGIAVYRRR